MNTKKNNAKGTPHLTPESLVGQLFGIDAFRGITIALVGFCPRPNLLDKYDPQNMSDQYFIHVPPASVQICKYEGIKFLSISHVYGGPVASALIEELAYYGINCVLAYGLAGGLGTKQLQMGDLYLVERALALDGTTPHYTDERLIRSDISLNTRIMEWAELKQIGEVTAVQAVTTDAIYREFDHELAYAIEQGCDIVNCDSAHLFAVSREMGIKTTQCGVISDVSVGDGEEWESKLSVMLSSKKEASTDPLARVGLLVEFYVENLVAELHED